MFAFGIDDTVITTAPEERVLEAHREVSPGVFKGWIKPIKLDETKTPAGHEVEGFDWLVKKGKVFQKKRFRKLKKEDLQARRAAAYPPVGEQLDALYKMAKVLADAGMALPEETKAWLEKVAAVKNSIPKEP